ncbi:MAG: penicillin-binding protein 2 [Actinobacteria bacterium]|nr:penicillin-binding protein 2 [Actinomycetota bacterium]
MNPNDVIRLYIGPRRMRAALAFCMAVLIIFGFRLFQLQALDAPQLAAAAAEKRTRTLILPAQRGEITDRNGAPLAITVDARDITVDQTMVIDPIGSANALSKITGVEASVLLPELVGDRRFNYVLKKVTPEQWLKIKESQLPGIFSEKTSKRIYPSNNLAASTIGFVGGEDTGLGGLEYGFEKELAGSQGEVIVEISAGGRPLPSGIASEKKSVPGMGIRLSIDRDLQFVAEQSLATRVEYAQADSGTLVAISPKTGKILAIATYPSFDANKPGEAQVGVTVNHALVDAYEPGSTAKVITIAGLLNENLASPNTKFTVPPVLKRSGKTFKDHEPHGTLKLTLTGVLAKSSNIGTIQASELMGAEKFNSYLQKFGVGQSTGMQFPGESKGRLPKLEKWSGTSFPTFAFGQGYMVTAVQIASMYATIANDGIRINPSLIEGYLMPNGQYQDAALSEKTEVISPRAAQTLREMMEIVVSDEGTAPLAGIPGYRVAGKTGTAQVVDPNCKCYSKEVIASFIGMAPAENPEIVVAVSVHNPKNGRYGGQLAGPVFKEVAQYALQQLNVPPSVGKPTGFPVQW